LFLVAPEWVVAVTFYTVFSLIQQKTARVNIRPMEA
jgi:hypothetical protein